jgi:hypothetical protein
MKRIGRSPEARVRWLLEFAARDLERLSPAARRVAWDTLFTLQNQYPVRVPPHHETVAETHQELRECIEAFANGHPYRLLVPGMSWTLRPPPRRPAGARHSARIARESSEARIMRSAMASAIVFAFVDDLNAIGADRLRACLLETDGRRCGVVFLARRRQNFCSRSHAQAAAWQNYSTKRKLRRR